ncbi:bile acid:sodium symporter family protein [Muricauda sp. DJ-13]|uniref:Bile acid:sodium symporter family protein n=2 Tax=Croceivirga thetidis TaxID=2721623 RepID=A0ABX1GSK0_9FLAO|nr:bile acid:sodium symporter family protein [Croceivirga thetidis]
MQKLGKLASISSLIFGLGALLFWILGNIELLAPSVILFLISLALVFSSSKHLQGFSFTIFIFAAVTASLFYPQFFLEIGSFKLNRLIVPLLIVIMFGMGTSIGIKDFVGVVKMPKGVLVGLLAQFTVMPFIGFGLAKLSGLPPEIAAGIILVGCSPGGLASNVMAYISGANLALSLTLTAVSTLLSPLLTPFFMQLLANELVPIDFLAMFWSIIKIVILPILAGLLFNHFFHGKFKWLDKAMPKVSMAGIAIIITIITASGRDSLLSIGLILIVVVIAHNLSGYLLGYYGGRLVGLDEKSSRTIAFEVGMQNAGLASGIALEMGRLATMGLAPAVFGPLMNITGSSLATIWKGKEPEE